MVVLCFLLGDPDGHGTLWNSLNLSDKAKILNTDSLASGWLICFIFLSIYLLKFIFFPLNLLDVFKSLWISENTTELAVYNNFDNLTEGKLII